METALSNSMLFGLTVPAIALCTYFFCTLQSEPFASINGGQIYVKDNTLCLYAQVTESCVG